LAAVALVAGVAGANLHDAAQANHRYDRARVSLSTIRRHTAVVSLELAQARSDVGLLTRQVAGEQTALSQDVSTLEGARVLLHAAEAHASKQATLAGSLHTCLGGVERALNALAVANLPSAIAALDEVSQSCSAAVAAGG
jgi:hypothetical protein